MGLSRPCALLVYCLALLGLLACGHIGGKINHAMTIGTILLQGVLFVALRKGLLDSCLKKPSVNIGMSFSESARQSFLKPSQGDRMHYLDNLKSTLVNCVVMAHCTLGFCGRGWLYSIGIQAGPPAGNATARAASGTNPVEILGMAGFEWGQSWAMVLFFFVSGYMVPSSFAKKGAKRYLGEALLRFGGPLVVGAGILMPLTIICVEFFTLGEVVHYWEPMAFHYWFLLYLLFFYQAYAIMDGEETRVKLPDMKVLLGCGALVGAAMGVSIPLMADGNILSMPYGLGSLFLDVMGFWCGVLAKNNDWLQDFERIECGWWLLAGAIATFSFTWVSGYLDGSDVFRDHLYLGIVQRRGALGWGTAVALGAYAGAECVIMCLAVIRFFQNYANHRSAFWDFLSGISYTVYIFHPLGVLPVQMACTVFLETYYNITAVGKVAAYIPGFALTLESDMSIDVVVLAVSWWVCVAASYVLTWCLCYAINQLPFMKKLLGAAPSKKVLGSEEAGAVPLPTEIQKRKDATVEEPVAPESPAMGA